MNDLDGDEGLLLIASFVVCLTSAVMWISGLRVATRLRVRTSSQSQVLLLPPVCLVLILLVLRLWADQEVRASRTYTLLLLLLGGAWLGIATRCFAWLGVSMRDDGVERNNRAAVAAWCGAMLGVTCAYSGGNIGAGPSLWNNVFSAALASGALAVLWLALELACGISSSIAIERDLASGMRGGGFLVAAGLILGRAVAGDWHSTAATVSDFARDAWPALVLAVVAFIGECAWRPTSRRIELPVATHGMLPAIGYLVFALCWLAYLGAWEGYK